MTPLLFTDTSYNFLAGAVSLFWDPGFRMYSRLQLQADALLMRLEGARGVEATTSPK